MSLFCKKTTLLCVNTLACLGSTLCLVGASRTASTEAYIAAKQFYYPVYQEEKAIESETPTEEEDEEPDCD